MSNEILRNIASQLVNIQEYDLTTAERNIAKILANNGIIRQRLDLTYELPPKPKHEDEEEVALGYWAKP